ncbi:unnamed protein product [Soboliphyme baturini]|uniref:RMI1_C domain-containing protein n=1 Tax=Soboliphyme baturini TaxID=241478 RepID=A0A183IDE5_9BILA|nr:unnamed protein product [Soboliphyme baturini]
MIRVPDVNIGAPRSSSQSSDSEFSSLAALESSPNEHFSLIKIPYIPPFDSPDSPVLDIEFSPLTRVDRYLRYMAKLRYKAAEANDHSSLSDGSSSSSDSEFVLFRGAGPSTVKLLDISDSDSPKVLDPNVETVASFYLDGGPDFHVRSDTRTGLSICRDSRNVTNLDQRVARGSKKTFTYLLDICHEMRHSTCPRVFVTKATIISIGNQLNANLGTKWTMTVYVNDGTIGIECSLVDSMLKDFIGFTAHEAWGIQIGTVKDLSARLAALKGVKSCGAFLQEFDGMIHIKFFPPTVLNTLPVIMKFERLNDADLDCMCYSSESIGDQ